ncbi:peptidoglycan-associated lipoprotein Pal [bacterium]|nr:MAG: peptidoglycan-associated lipoprotein Pal [bacterium]
MTFKKLFKGLILSAAVLGLLSACAGSQQAVSEQQKGAEVKKEAPAQPGQEKPKPTEAEIAAQREAAVQKAAQEEAQRVAKLAAAGLGPDGKPLKGETEPPVVPPKTSAGTADEGNLKRVHFEFDKFNITPEAADILKKNRDYLMSRPNVRILIEGHCDERGTVDYNLALGERRANAVRRFLEDLRIDSRRMDIISYGEERPLDPAANEDAWAKNRRADFREL